MKKQKIANKEVTINLNGKYIVDGTKDTASYHNVDIALTTLINKHSGSLDVIIKSKKGQLEKLVESSPSHKKLSDEISLLTKNKQDHPIKIRLNNIENNYLLECYASDEPEDLLDELGNRITFAQTRLDTYIKNPTNYTEADLKELLDEIDNLDQEVSKLNKEINIMTTELSGYSITGKPSNKKSKDK